MNARHYAVLLLPLVLVLSAYWVFTSLSRQFGSEKGYLLGFLYYWMFWCLLVPFLFLGKRGFASLFVDKIPPLSPPNWLAAFMWAFITLVTIFMYGREFLRAPLILILVAVPAATLNGFCEEILWRGLYTRMFPENIWLAILFPAVGFALWHLVPLSVFSDGNKWAFILSTFFLGLAYGFIAYRTGSVTWTAISHSLNGILALSGMLAPSILHWLGR